ncbi:hypothetical protein FEM48_Zijuj09G0052700 [Ziziphus jujuba var. spinosa]|uniref:Uncharacterized protein n=1 Tax=Ziziphus jujuba var. spinosa TaxID=714518 RepID=A0A978UR36_ZIZJJ|nr:hypothetical protein FEM48_Zijuj09G0052700 [Ziziphus jujuba var. spinosa]
MLPQLYFSFSFFILTLLFFFFIKKKSSIHTKSLSPSSSTQLLPKIYPIAGHFFAIFRNQYRHNQFYAEVLQNSPSAIFVFRNLFDPNEIVTANPADVVETELTNRLLPILSVATTDKSSVLDFQDILQCFAFDNICNIAFGYDPAYLSPSLPHTKFAIAFDDTVKISGVRSDPLIPIIWKIKKLFGIGSEKRLATAISEVRDFAITVIREKKNEFIEKSSLELADLLSRDPYSYPVFQVGPRSCMGKKMAFLQMKRVVAEVLRRFRVVPAMVSGEVQERSQTLSD